VLARRDRQAQVKEGLKAHTVRPALTAPHATGQHTLEEVTHDAALHGLRARVGAQLQPLPAMGYGEGGSRGGGGGGG
jgi:hypothetical protein